MSLRRLAILWIRFAVSALFFRGRQTNNGHFKSKVTFANNYLPKAVTSEVREPCSSREEASNVICGDLEKPISKIRPLSRSHVGTHGPRFVMGGMTRHRGNAPHSNESAIIMAGCVSSLRKRTMHCLCTGLNTTKTKTETIIKSYSF